MIDLSIVIVNWNTSRLLLQCLNSIHDSKSQLAVEIIVVDNGSSDDSVPMVQRQFPDVIVIQNHQNLGFAKANNRGISAAKGRYYLLLNSDTIVTPGALDKLVQLADSRSEVAVVGPKLLNGDGTLQKSWGSFPTFWSEVIGRNFRQQRPVPDVPFAFEVDSIGGACLLVRAQTVAAVGMLDEEYFMYSEEIDWCFRIKKNGWQILYLSNAEIIHLGGGSADRTSLKQLLHLYQGKILFFKKNYGNFRATILRYGLVIANIFGIIRRTIFLRSNDTKLVQSRLADQRKLVLCLLRNQFSFVND